MAEATRAKVDTDPDTVLLVCKQIDVVIAGTNGSKLPLRLLL